jgi:hypothetical protein
MRFRGEAGRRRIILSAPIGGSGPQTRCRCLVATDLRLPSGDPSTMRTTRSTGWLSVSCDAANEMSRVHLRVQLLVDVLQDAQFADHRAPTQAQFVAGDRCDPAWVGYVAPDREASISSDPRSGSRDAAKGAGTAHPTTVIL